jgi:ABC-type phosphate/phosphonate transport system substrate-binding protein
MRYRLLIGLTTAALLSLGTVSVHAAEDTAAPCPACAPLKIGAVAYSPNSVTIFRGIRHYFAKNQTPVEFVLYSTYDDLGRALKDGHVDVAWNSPLGHGKFHVLAGGQSQALLMRDVDRNYRIKLVVRKDASIERLTDLHGKTMVFGSCDSAEATVLPTYFLKKEGVNFDQVKVLSLHSEVDALGVPCHSERHVLQALLAGRGQAGILSEGLWRRLQQDQPAEAARFKEIWTSPGLSHCVFTARKDFDKDRAERFTKLMLAMDGKDPLTAEILKLEHCSKWVPGSQEGYEALLQALREGQTLSGAIGVTR